MLEYIYAGLWEYVLIVKVYFWHLSEYLLSANLYLLWWVFLINLLNFQNLRGVLILVSLSVVVSTYRPA